MALAALSSPRPPTRAGDAAILPASPTRAPAPGEAQRPSEGRLYRNRGSGRNFGVERVRDLQAGPALVAHHALRRLRAGPLLAFRLRVDLRRVHAFARAAGA